MGPSSPSEEVSRAELLLAVARVKGSLLSAKEIDELTGLLPEGSDPTSIWTQIPGVESRYELQSGLLIEKNRYRSSAPKQILADSNQRRARAQRYVEYPQPFHSTPATTCTQ